jgi:hypothetical protein
MVQYDKKVINKLLDIYENSLLSTGENKRNVKIELKFTKANVPEYFDESSFSYEDIHIQMKNLEEKGLIQIIWKEQKVDYVIQKIRLNTGQTAQAYAYVRRTPKRNLEEENKKFLEAYVQDEKQDSDAPITEAFAGYLKERLEHHQSVKEYIDLSDMEETGRLFKALAGVEKNKKQCYIREFSIVHFQDSKYFEQIKNHVAKIFRKFHPEYAAMDTAEILAEYGIYHTPNYVYLKGNITIGIEEESIKLRNLNQGLGISGEDLGKVSFSDLSRIERVITIENLTTFFRWHEPGSLIIYLGGYHNGIRRTLLKKIYQELPGIAYYHFGDIDAGGFAILKDLRNKTGIPFQAYYMDLETLKRYEPYGKRLTESDRSRLEDLNKNAEWTAVISYMLTHNVKLEQECVGIAQ